MLGRKVRDHRVKILVPGYDAEPRVRGPQDGMPEVVCQSQIERVATGGPDFHQFNLGRQAADLLNEREIDFLLVLPDQDRDMDRLSLHETEIDLRDVLKVHKYEMGNSGGCHGWSHCSSAARTVRKLFRPASMFSTMI